MSSYIARPDSRPPLVGRIVYAGLCHAIRHPRLLRLVGAVLRAWPALGGGGIVARRSAVQAVLERPASFSNSSHAPNLVAGDFLIGMDRGPGYDADALLFHDMLATIDVEAGATREARSRAAALEVGAGKAPFDLVEDYLAWVVLRALEPGFGAAADVVLAGSRDRAPDAALERRHMHEVRHVAAHLFAGAVAPADVQRRAELAAASLRSRVIAAMPEFSMSWPRGGASGYGPLRRDAIGLAWVSHPVTVQAGALVMQELLGRRQVMTALRQQAAGLGDAAFTDPAFRLLVRGHVLELMRFRPVFPSLARDVPRATEIDSGARKNPRCPAGSGVRPLSIAALFDPRGTPDADEYHPMRQQGRPAPWQTMMFGHGERRCPAQSQALTILTSALIGLLTLPELGWADPWPRRMRYDGPMVCRMMLRAA